MEHGQRGFGSLLARAATPAQTRLAPLADIKAGKKPAAFVRGGLKEGFVRTSPYGPAVSDAARRAADGVKTQFMAGSFVIFRGPLKDNAGNLVIPAGTAHGQTAMELERMNYLVEGAIGR